MRWLEVSVKTNSGGIEHVTARLLALGFPCVEIEDETDFKEFLEQNRKYWDYVDEELCLSKRGVCRVKLYLTDNEDGRAQLSVIKSGLDELKKACPEFGSLEVSLKDIDEEDWAEAWKKFYKPIAVGQRILIKPEWEKLDKPTDRIVFENNPGMSFGTGDHESTRLCAEALEKNIHSGEEVLDLGCGSGILFIIALLLGASFATAADLDPNSVKTARENALRNGMTEEDFRLFTGNILEDETLMLKISDRKYDVILANIVSDVIISLTPFIAKLLKPGGVFITSGIITERRAEVKNALEAEGFIITGMTEERGWSCIICTGSSL